MFVRLDVSIKRDKGHKKPHISQKLDVLEKALVGQGFVSPQLFFRF